VTANWEGGAIHSEMISGSSVVVIRQRETIHVSFFTEFVQRVRIMLDLQLKLDRNGGVL